MTRATTTLRRPFMLLAILGPGLIAANAGNDAGGIATYASAGAQYGYRMLFVMLVVTVALVIVQEMSARLGATTGRGLVSLVREQFSLRLATFCVVCLLVANLGLVVSELAGVGAAMEMLGVTPVPVGSARCCGRVGRRDVRLLPLRRASLRAPLAGVPRVSDRRDPRASRLDRGGEQHPHAALRGVEGLPRAHRRAHRDDHHALHAAVPGKRGRRTGRGTGGSA